MKRMWTILIINALFFNFVDGKNKDEIILCSHCHSHNDYFNEIPLYNALKHGFKSIEVDIVLHDESLYVSHSRWGGKKNVLIENVYLDNLYKIFNKNNGFIYKKDEPLFLLVDIKTSANDTYMVLEKILNNYKPMLSHVIDDIFFKGAVTIILSGNKPKTEFLEKLKVRYVFLDGRLSDLGKNISINMMPLISVNWKDEFRWTGKRSISNKEQKKLNLIISEVHLEEKKIRFWGSPDTKNSWKTQYLSGVDLINSDRIIELYNYMIIK